MCLKLSGIFTVLGFQQLFSSFEEFKGLYRYSYNINNDEDDYF